MLCVGASAVAGARVGADVARGRRGGARHAGGATLALRPRQCVGVRVHVEVGAGQVGHVVVVLELRVVDDGRRPAVRRREEAARRRRRRAARQLRRARRRRRHPGGGALWRALAVGPLHRAQRERLDARPPAVVRTVADGRLGGDAGGGAGVAGVQRAGRLVAPRQRVAPLDRRSRFGGRRARATAAQTGVGDGGRPLAPLAAAALPAVHPHRDLAPLPRPHRADEAAVARVGHRRRPPRLVRRPRRRRAVLRPTRRRRHGAVQPAGGVDAARPRVRRPALPARRQHVAALCRRVGGRVEGDVGAALVGREVPVEQLVLRPLAAAGGVQPPLAHEREHQRDEQRAHQQADDRHPALPRPMVVVADVDDDPAAVGHCNGTKQYPLIDV